MKRVLLVVCLVGSARADGAFCELTPCVPGPVTRRTLTADEPAGKVTCKKGKELGVDTQKRIVFCTTAKPVDVDGIPVAADAYTLFHPSGHIYQTHTRAPYVATLADGSKVTCASDLVALEDDGHLRYCKLGAPRAGSPKPRVGDGIRFHPSGKLAGMTLADPYSAAGLALPAGASVAWDGSGALLGGHLPAAITAGGLSIRGDFTLHPGGALKSCALAAPAKLSGHDFPEDAELVFRANGHLEKARYESAHGFMIHGEEWTDTLYQDFDDAGKVTSSHVDHWQSDVRPPKFK